MIHKSGKYIPVSDFLSRAFLPDTYPNLVTGLDLHVHTVLQQLFTLSSTGSILSNTDLSDLSTVGTCDIFVYQMRHRVM